MASANEKLSSEVKQLKKMVPKRILTNKNSSMDGSNQYESKKSQKDYNIDTTIDKLKENDIISEENDDYMDDGIKGNEIGETNRNISTPDDIVGLQ